MSKFKVGNIVQLKPIAQLYKSYTNKLKSNPDAILAYDVYTNLLNNKFKNLFDKNIRIIDINILGTETFYIVSEFNEPIHENYFQLRTNTLPKW
jgi:hypothetical protein